MNTWISREGSQFLQYGTEPGMYPFCTQISDLMPGHYRLNLDPIFYRWTLLEFELRSDTTIYPFRGQNLRYVGKPDTSLFRNCDTLEFTDVTIGCFVFRQYEYMIAKDSTGSWRWWGVSHDSEQLAVAQPCGPDMANKFSKAVQKMLDTRHLEEQKPGEWGPITSTGRTMYIQAGNAVMGADEDQGYEINLVADIFWKLREQAARSEQAMGNGGPL